MDIQPDQMTMQRFRAMAKTLLDEVSGYRLDYIEHQLAHVVRDPLGWTYNRTAHLPQRREMMQERVDWLDRLKDGKKGRSNPRCTADIGSPWRKQSLPDLRAGLSSLPARDHCGESDPPPRRVLTVNCEVKTVK